MHALEPSRGRSPGSLITWLARAELEEICKSWKGLAEIQSLQKVKSKACINYRRPDSEMNSTARKIVQKEGNSQQVTGRQRVPGTSIAFPMGA